MTKTMPISKARVKLGAVVNQVYKKGTQIILEKNGIPVAVVVSVNDWEDYLELNNPKIQKQIDKSYRNYKKGNFYTHEEVFTEMRKKYPIKNR